jgi:acyl-CoA reductase-like NAD-dependent aldehyde dehydrogenase
MTIGRGPTDAFLLLFSFLSSSIKVTAMAQVKLTAQDLVEVTLYVDGSCLPSGSARRLPIYNPASGEVLGEIPEGCTEDVDKAVSSARRTFYQGVWRNTPPSSRKATLHRWAALIEANAARLDALDALEMGKPVSLRTFSAIDAAGLMRFNAEAIDKYSGDVLTSDSSSTVIQKRTPRGVVAAIVPWNFPTYNAVLKIAPALAAGNSVILKPSELATQSALQLAKLAIEAGLPPGALNVVPGRGEIVGRALGEHMDVDMLTFTGSSAVGKLMLQYSGRSNMKVISAECGGKSPQIVFDDGVDLDAVANSIAGMLILNQGQVCSVGSRLLVQDTAEEALIKKVISRMEKIKPGDPQFAATTYGPLASKAQLNKVISHIQDASADGADLVYGAARLLEETGGYFVEPAIFVNVEAESRVAQEEVFGPVLSVLRFRDVAEAIRLANATHYGLAAYVWTSQISTGFKLADAMRTGVTMVSAVAPAGEGPSYAFSGEPAGLSGIGVEGGIAGMETYMRRQTLWLNHG